MNHVMLAKFKPEYSKDEIRNMFEDIKSIYENAKAISGVSDVIYRTNCIDRPNRYDISVNIVMAKEALPRWDESEWHALWKKKYGETLESKCIFDYEE